MLRAFILATACVLGYSAISNAADDSLVTVQGSGTVYAKPDCVHVNLAVVGENVTAAKAYAINKDVGAKVFEAVKANKIEDADVNSVGFSFNRTYDNKTSAVTGFQVVHRISVKVKDIKSAGKLVDDVVAAGAQLEGLQFVVSDRTAHLEKARALAVADAKSKAEQIAKGLGTSLDRVRAISESSGGYRGDYAPAVTRGTSGESSLQLAAGDQAIVVSVSASWVLK